MRFILKYFCGSTVQALRARLYRFKFGFCCVLVLLVLPLLLNGSSLLAQNDDSLSPYVIAMHLSSNPETSEDALEVTAIKAFVSKHAEHINSEGGIHGRPLDVRFFDDDLKAEKTIENVDAALKIPNLLGMIGVWSSTRGAGVVDRAGKSGVPFITEMSVATLFSSYPNIYTLTRSVGNEHEVLVSSAKDNGYSRLAFVGTADDLYTKTYHEHLSGKHRKADKPASDLSVVSTYWLDGEIEDNFPDVDKTIEEIKSQGADIVFLSIRSKPGAVFLGRLADAGVDVPVFIALGSIQGVMGFDGGRAYKGPLLEIAEGGVANLNNERLQELARDQEYGSSNSKFKANHIGYGARYRDLLSLVVEAARSSPSKDVSKIRASILGKLGSLRANRSYWKGKSQHWSFTKDRSSAEHALIVWQPPGENRKILSPFQYVRQDDRFIRVPVLYVHLDMIRVYGIDSNDKSFEAEFFFTTRSEMDVPISSIKFTNAFRAQNSKDPIINIRQVHEQHGEKVGAGGTKIYHVSGRFRFEPDLARYPFDAQVLSISFQPATTSTAFFLQPPSEQLRHQNFDVDGWVNRDHYVGTNDLIIRSISGPMMDEYVIPYYTFNYTWVMQRQVIDYILRVIVPLTCILIVSYLAVFIPRVEFNATVAIQVTALLSAIALYFALNQPQSDDATLSDMIFVVSYAVIALMIALSIFEVNTQLVHEKRVLSFVRVSQIYIVPLITISALIFLTLY